MKRTPLKRTAGLKRTSTLKSKAEMKGGNRLPSRSAKRVREDRSRADAKVVVAKRSAGYCEAWVRWREIDADVPLARCKMQGEQFHEPLTRARGGAIDDPDNMLHVCGPCHRYLHDHPALAEQAGLLIRSTNV